MTADKLKDAFSLAGRVVEAELRTEDDGRSKGFGTVEYESILEAMHAVAAFNEQELFGRSMRVRIYVPDDARKQLRDRERDLERLELDPRRVRLPDGLRSVGPGRLTLLYICTTYLVRTCSSVIFQQLAQSVQYQTQLWDSIGININSYFLKQ